MNWKRLPFVILICASLVLAACGGTQKATEATKVPVAVATNPPAAEPVTLVFWNGFNAHEVDTLNQMIEKYWNPTHPNIKIEAKGEVGPDQILTAVSGGETVDVAILWDPTPVKVWAYQGALVDLTPYIETQNANLEDIFVPAGLEWVKQADGHYFGLPFVNFNRGFYWNKDLFRKAGLDPEKPPQNITELAEYARKLTIVENGEIKQLGWAINQDPSNLIELAMAFGGHFYNAQTGQITATDPKIIEALKWDVSLAKEFSLEKVNSFVAGFTGAGNDPFVLGKVAMTLSGCWTVTFIKNSGVTLDYGVGALPTADPAYARSNEVETNPIVVLKNTKHPQQAFEFAWFLATNPDVSREFANLVSNLPQVKAAMSNFSSDPKTMVFVDLSNSPNARGWAPITVSAFFITEWTTAVQNIYTGSATPEEAMEVVNKNVQAEADKYK